MTFLFSRAWGLYLDLPVPWCETTSSGSLLELELQANIQKPCGIPECLIRLHWNLLANISSIQLYHLSGLVFLNGAIARIWSLFFHGVRPCRFIGTCFLTSCPYLQKKSGRWIALHGFEIKSGFSFPPDINQIPTLCLDLEIKVDLNHSSLKSSLNGLNDSLSLAELGHIRLISALQTDQYWILQNRIHPSVTFCC